MRPRGPSSSSSEELREEMDEEDIERRGAPAVGGEAPYRSGFSASNFDAGSAAIGPGAAAGFPASATSLSVSPVPLRLTLVLLAFARVAQPTNPFSCGALSDAVGVPSELGFESLPLLAGLPRPSFDFSQEETLPEEAASWVFGGRSAVMVVLLVGCWVVGVGPEGIEGATRLVTGSVGALGEVELVLVVVVASVGGTAGPMSAAGSAVEAGSAAGIVVSVVSVPVGFSSEVSFNSASNWAAWVPSSSIGDESTRWAINSAGTEPSVPDGLSTEDVGSTDVLGSDVTDSYLVSVVIVGSREEPSAGGGCGPMSGESTSIGSVFGIGSSAGGSESLPEVGSTASMPTTFFKLFDSRCHCIC